MNKVLIKKKLFLVLFVLLSYMLVMTLHLHDHELAHEQIAYHHGCNDSRIFYENFTFYFECTNYQNTRWQKQEFLLHNQNEIYGYNTVAILNSIFFLGLIIVLNSSKS